MESGIETKNPYFRPGTVLKDQRIAFSFNHGGLGDFIQWVPAVKYAIESCDYLSGIVVVPTFFKDLAEMWFDQYKPRFSVYVCDAVERDGFVNTFPIKGPSYFDNIDAMGSNLMRLGFGYFMNIDLLPSEYRKLPAIYSFEHKIKNFDLPDEYAVITTEATAKARMLPGKTINDICEYVLKQGITPVFLGKKDLKKDYKSFHDEEINYALGIDLREQTTLIEAACIMDEAMFVAGLDNGLLHLAMCTEAPVIYGFTTVRPDQRISPRPFPNAPIVVVEPPPELSCRFCQSNMRHLIGHDYRECLYKDYLCTKSLTAESFISAIEMVFKKE